MRASGASEEGGGGGEGCGRGGVPPPHGREIFLKICV